MDRCRQDQFQARRATSLFPRIPDIEGRISGHRGRPSPDLDLSTLRQLVGYILHDVDDTYRLDRAGIYEARYGTPTPGPSPTFSRDLPSTYRPPGATRVPRTNLQVFALDSGVAQSRALQSRTEGTTSHRSTTRSQSNRWSLALNEPLEPAIAEDMLRSNFRFIDPMGLYV